MLKSIISFITDRYFLATALFLTWIILFADNNLLQQYQENKELQAMKDKISFLETEIKKMRKESEALQKDPKAIEKYAREKYHMKKEHEDLFVFDTITAVESIPQK